MFGGGRELAETEGGDSGPGELAVLLAAVVGEDDFLVLHDEPLSLLELRLRTQSRRRSCHLCP